MTERQAIVCRGLIKHYGVRTAVGGVDLAVGEGEIFGLLGPNGAGKTTILKMILGLVHPSAGDIFIFGAKAPCPDKLRQVGAMVEKPSFYPWLTGRANLRVFLDSGPPAPAGAIESALSLVGMTDAADRRTKTYSQGMGQRLGMAVALLRNPRLLILDEPTNGLDPAGIRDFRELMLKLSGAGVTILLSSHLLSEVERLCHRVAFISHGLITDLRSVDALTRSDRLRVTVAAAQLAGGQAALAQFETTTVAPNVLLVGGATGEQVGAALAKVGIFASSIEREHDSLEDIYLAAMSPQDKVAG
jgi:ABC-2 type transport system ATP-binding protein